MKKKRLYWLMLLCGFLLINQTSCGGGGGGNTSSPAPPSATDQGINSLISANNQVQAKINEYSAQYDPNTALNMAAGYIKTLPGISNAQYYPDSAQIEITESLGMKSLFLLHNPGNIPNPSLKLSLPKSTYNNEGLYSLLMRQLNISPTGKKALILTPFQFQFDPDGSRAANIVQSLSNAGFEITYKKNSDVTLDIIKTLNNYDVIYIETHGGVLSSNHVVLTTGVTITDANSLDQETKDNLAANNLISLHVSGNPNTFLTFTDDYIRHRFQSNPFNNNLIVAMACYSADNSSMADAFTSLGAAAYIGFKDESWTDYIQAVATVLFSNLSQAGTSLSTAFNTAHSGFPISWGMSLIGDIRLTLCLPLLSSCHRTDVVEFVRDASQDYILNPIASPSPPSPPSGFQVAAASSSEIDLSWTASAGTVTGYKVYKSGGNLLKTVTTTSTSDTGLNASTNYCYYVIAYNSAGDSVQTSQLCATTQNLASTYSIAGSVTLNGSGLSGVTITLTGSGSTSTITNSNGNYTFADAQNGSYTVTPSMTGYTFTPANQAVTINGANATASNFIASAQFSQQGPKLVGTGAVGSAEQGRSVSISADGNTAIVGGDTDNSGAGAAWIWTRSGGTWTQGPKLVGSDAIVSTIGSRQGTGVALSADGNTAMVGGWNDTGTWVFTRSGNIWTQQGAKLVPSGVPGFGAAGQGFSVALSADGNTAIIGGPWNNTMSHGESGAWVWTRSGDVWTQQGPILVGSGAIGDAYQGFSVSLSADGNTAIVGGDGDNNYVGAAWIWTRSGGVWTQQGPKLVGSGAVGGTNEGNGTGGQGFSVSISADGNTAIVGGPWDGVLPSDNTGAVWVWTRSGGVWTQQGNKLVGPGGVSAAIEQGASVSLSADGNMAIVGGVFWVGGSTWSAAAFVWTRSGGVWTQQGTRLVGSAAVAAVESGSGQDVSVSLSADGNTVIVGGETDNSSAGAAWVFSRQ